MTTGSYDRNFQTSSPNGPVGRRNLKVWSGDDRPKAEKSPKPPLRTIVRNGRTFSFREKTVRNYKPPKRGRETEHNYTMLGLSENRTLCDFWSSGGSEIGGQATLPTFMHPDAIETQLLDDNDQLKLIAKLREKMQGSDFNLALVLGEGHQTLRMLGDTAIRLAKGLHHLRRGDLAGTARSLLEGTSRKPIRPYKDMKPFRPTVDRMSSHWLELQYGWKPLLGDAKAGAEFLAHKLSVPVAQTYRMSVMRGSSLTKHSTVNLRPPGVIHTTRLVHRRSLKVVVTEPASLVAQLGLLDPEIVAWELVPWSFVVDWFLPIGQWLEARAAVAHVTIPYHVITDYWYMDAGPPEPSPTLSGGDWQSAFLRRGRVARRVVFGKPSVPLPKFKSLRQAASVDHCLNAIALLGQVVTGRLNKRDRDRALTDSLPNSDPRRGLIPRAGTGDR